MYVPPMPCMSPMPCERSAPRGHATQAPARLQRPVPPRSLCRPPRQPVPLPRVPRDDGAVRLVIGGVHQLPCCRWLPAILRRPSQRFVAGSSCRRSMPNPFPGRSSLRRRHDHHDRSQVSEQALPGRNHGVLSVPRHIDKVRHFPGRPSLRRCKNCVGSPQNSTFSRCCSKGRHAAWRSGQPTGGWTG